MRSRTHLKCDSFFFWIEAWRLHIKRLPCFSSLRESFDFQMQDTSRFFGDAEWVPDSISRHPDNLFLRANQWPICPGPPGDFYIGIKILYFCRLPVHAQRGEHIPSVARADYQGVSRQRLSIQPGRPIFSVVQPGLRLPAELGR